FHLAFRAVTLIGRREHGLATDADELLLRVLTPITKLTTAKQAVAAASEAIESFGGAGYVEDTGLPRILADAQVLPIWEGTTNVLSLDTLRALASEGAFDALVTDTRDRAHRGADADLKVCVEAVDRALEHAGSWLARTMDSPEALEAGARRFALTMGRALELALMIEHAQWCTERGDGARAQAAARRFTSHGVDLIADLSRADARVLVSQAGE
ncbi:MAG TPA: acyl-CoA dehydrogenase family protein, partial [Kofleriaceae bacterium]|nr:acyl-CoA dehydrogenase family protein [Kofleriaceae bacterium]